MSLEQFLELLDLYGARRAHWPEAQRPGAERLLSESAEARRALEEAELLDGALASFDAPEPRVELVARIAAIPSRHPREAAWWPFATLYRPMLAMAAAALLGIGVGNWAFSSTASVESQTELSSGDVEELSSLAFGDGSSDALLGVDAFFDAGASEGSEGAP